MQCRDLDEKQTDEQEENKAHITQESSLFVELFRMLCGGICLHANVEILYEQTADER
jgi:hypothetical protein